MLNNLKIGTRLLGGFLLLALMLLALALINYQNIKSINDGMETLFDDRTVPIQQLSKINAALLKSRGDLYRAILFREETAKIQQTVAGQFQAGDKELADYKATYLLPAEKENLAKFEPAWAAFKRESETILEQLRNMNIGVIMRALQSDAPIIASRNTALAALEQLIEINTREAERIHHEGEKTYTTTIIESAVITVGAILLAVLTGLFIARSITRPLSYGVDFAQAIAKGDLSRRIDPQYLQRSDEIGDLAQALDQMALQLRNMVSQVTEATTQVNSAATEIAQGSTDLSQRTERQASTLEETASSMEQLTSTVKQSADHAGHANQLSLLAQAKAEQGRQAVQHAIVAMNAINVSSCKISNIIVVINEIAFQTNLLALNAAVEAARVGEQGRGFAVVAGEVRKLAQRSANAAKEIKDLITDSVNKVEDGGKLVDQAGQTLQEIVVEVKKVSELVTEVATATQEQSSGIEQINRAILQMDQTTQQNAALVEQTAAASQSMGDQAHGLQNLMDFFKLNQSA